MSVFANSNNNASNIKDNYFDNLIRDKLTDARGAAKECFTHFDKNGDGVLNIQEFHELCGQLISPHPEDDLEQEWSQKDTERIMQLLNENQTEVLSDDRIFQECWENWIHPILAPKCALMIVDVQNDFISGSLALRNGPAQQDGERVVSVINSLLDTVQFDEVIYSKDWHPNNHISFYDNLHLRRIHNTSKIAEGKAKPFDTVIFEVGSKLIEQRLWPVHCLQNSTGAKLHKDLKIVPNHLEALKGTNPLQDNYSVLYPDSEPNNNTSGAALAMTLRQKGITDLFVCGIAYDVCVGYTAMDSRSFGFRTIIVDDACCGFADDGIAKMGREMTDAGCASVTSKQVASMISGSYRHPVLAHNAAVDLSRRNKRKSSR